MAVKELLSENRGEMMSRFLYEKGLCRVPPRNSKAHRLQIKKIKLCRKSVPAHHTQT